MIATLSSTMTLEQALSERFTDLDEIKDIARMGCSGGVSDFIYYSETKEFFFKYQDQIEAYMEDQLGDDWLARITSNSDSVDHQLNNIVWFVVESWCQSQID
jgi:hypothetical protein